MPLPSLSTIAASLVGAYILSYIYAFIRNALNARKTGLPSIYVPVHQQNFLWMIISPPLRGWFEALLPTLEAFDDYYGSQADLRTFMLVTCGRLELFTSNAEFVTQILSRPKDFMQLDIGSWIMGVFGDNVLTSDGEHWARQRKVLASVVNERVSKAVFTESVTQTQGLLEELSSQRQSNHTTETNQLFNMAKKVAINVLSAAGMGAPVPWHDDTDERPKPGFRLTYIQAVKKVIESVAGPIVIAICVLENSPSSLPGGTFMRELGVAKKEFPIHTRDMLENERIRSRSEGSATKRNVLSQLIQASEEPVDAKDSKAASGKSLSEDGLVGNLFIFTAAGFDTTANTLSYALVSLARFPQWQDWLLEEIDAILPASPDEELDYTTIFPKAIRTMAFMLETLRRFTPLVHISKQAKSAQTLTTSTGTYWLPANTTVYISSTAFHANPDLRRGLNAAADEKIAADDEWHFRPSRWINPPGAPQALFQPPRGAYISWSAGPRVCPGQKMAQVEFTAIFLTLLRRHRIDAVALPGETRAETDTRLDQTMQNGVSILTIMMKDVYDVPADSEKGLKLGLTRRK